jgi:hypothetical protein
MDVHDWNYNTAHVGVIVGNCFFQFSGRLWKAEHVDVVYPILHGKYLQDGCCRSSSMNSQVKSGRINTFYISESFIYQLMHKIVALKEY